MRRYLTALLSVFALLMGYEVWGDVEAWFIWDQGRDKETLVGTNDRITTVNDTTVTANQNEIKYERNNAEERAGFIISFGKRNLDGDDHYADSICILTPKLYDLELDEKKTLEIWEELLQSLSPVEEAASNTERTHLECDNSLNRDFFPTSIYAKDLHKHLPSEDTLRDITHPMNSDDPNIRWWIRWY